MDRRELRELLDHEGVEERYSLTGEPVEDGLTLEVGPRESVVFYTERGRRGSESRFATEDEACRYLAQELLADPSNRYKVVAESPDRGVSPDEYLYHWLAASGMARENITSDDFKIDTMRRVGDRTTIRLSVRRTYLRARGISL